MPIHNDDQFESYLTQFRPLPLEPLPFQKRGAARWRSLTVACAAAAAGVIVVLLILHPSVPSSHQSDNTARWTGASPTGEIQPLTIHSANALLNRAPSFKVAVDAMAVPSPKASWQGKQSAFDVLSKDSKL